MDHTTSGTGRCMVCLMKKASTLVTYSEGGPVPAVLPFIRLWRSLRILSCNTETAHKISPSISPLSTALRAPYPENPGALSPKVTFLHTLSHLNNVTRNRLSVMLSSSAENAPLHNMAQDEVAEWLRRWTANPLCSARGGFESHPVD